MFFYLPKAGEILLRLVFVWQKRSVKVPKLFWSGLILYDMEHVWAKHINKMNNYTPTALLAAELACFILFVHNFARAGFSFAIMRWSKRSTSEWQPQWSADSSIWRHRTGKKHVACASRYISRDRCCCHFGIGIRASWMRRQQSTNG